MRKLGRRDAHGRHLVSALGLDDQLGHVSLAIEATSIPRVGTYMGVREHRTDRRDRILDVRDFAQPHRPESGAGIRVPDLGDVSAGRHESEKVPRRIARLEDAENEFGGAGPSKKPRLSRHFLRRHAGYRETVVGEVWRENP